MEGFAEFQAMVWDEGDKTIVLIEQGGRIRAGRLIRAFLYQPGRKCWQIPSQQRPPFPGALSGVPQSLRIQHPISPTDPQQTLIKSPFTYPPDGALTTSHGSGSTLPGICLLPLDVYFLALFEVHLNPAWKFNKKKKKCRGLDLTAGLVSQTPSVCETERLWPFAVLYLTWQPGVRS